MDLFTLLKSAVRRWWIAVPILLIAGAFALTLVSNRAVEYSAQGSQLVVASPNALGASDPSVPATLIARSVAELMMSSSVRTDVEDEGLSSRYSVTVDDLGTVLQLSVVADTAAEAAATAEYLDALAPDLAVEALGERASGYEFRAVRKPEADDASPTDGDFTLTSPVVVIPRAASQLNPFPATLGTVRSLLEVARTADVAVAVLTEAPTARYSVTSELRDAAPIVRISIVADDEDDAAAGYVTVIEQLDLQLRALQLDAGVDEADLTSLRDLARPTAAVPTYASVVRPVAGIVVLGLAAAFGGAVLADTVIVMRRGRTRRGQTGQATAVSVPAADRPRRLERPAG